MRLGLSQLRPIIKALRDRGYKKTPMGNYSRLFEFSDVPNLAIRYEVTIDQLVLCREGFDEFLYQIYVKCMDELAAAETKQRFANKIR